VTNNDSARQLLSHVRNPCFYGSYCLFGYSGPGTEIPSERQVVSEGAGALPSDYMRTFYGLVKEKNPEMSSSEHLPTQSTLEQWSSTHGSSYRIV